MIRRRITSKAHSIRADTTGAERELTGGSRVMILIIIIKKKKKTSKAHSTRADTTGAERELTGAWSRVIIPTPSPVVLFVRVRVAVLDIFFFFFFLCCFCCCCWFCCFVVFGFVFVLKKKKNEQQQTENKENCWEWDANLWVIVSLYVMLRN